MFRDDKFYMSRQEKEYLDQLTVMKLRTELEIMILRRDEYRSRIRSGDNQVNQFFRDEISNTEVLDEVVNLWKAAVKKDEENVDDHQVKKIENIMGKFNYYYCLEELFASIANRHRKFHQK